MDCVHRWNLDVVPAKCRYCGDEKEFALAIQYASWNTPRDEAAYQRRHAIRSSKRYAMGD